MPASTSPPDKILWTCLPNGVDQGAAGGPALRIAVLVSPRLGSFTLFSNWPEIVPHLTFAVEIKTDPAGPEIIQPRPTATRITLDPAAALDPKLWASLFPPETFVRPHDPAKPARYADKVRRNGIQTYGVRNVAAHIKQTYQGVEPSTPHQLPTAAHPTLARMVADLGQIATNAAGARETVVAAMAATPRITASTRLAELNPPPAQASLTQASLDFVRMHAYHTRALSAPAAPPSAGLPPPPKPHLPPTPPTLDFHQMVSSLGDYPLILRRLGLIIDLEIPFTAAVPSDSQLRLVVSGGGLPPQDPQPWTSYLLTDKFVAKPVSPAGPGSLHDGVIDLTGVDDSHALNAANDFEIVQIDPDGAGAKLLNFIAAVARSPLHALLGPTGQEPFGLPALRSAGLSVAKTDRHTGVETSITNAATWSQSATPPPVLHAEDLLRGYRVDVLDETQGSTWRSLCARLGTYKLRDGSILDVPADEGYVKAASTTSQYAPKPEDADPASPLYLHESIVRWAGWSLCAGRPGKTIMDEGTADVANDAHPVNTTGLSVNFRTPPGSLPRLRFGHSYRIRLRAVDLAGGGLKLSDPPAFVSNPVVYARFDPIHPPAVVPTDVVGEGESVERLVIRSNFDKTAAQYANDPTVEKALDGRQYAPTNDRHIVPPKTSLQMAETHGAFDRFMGGGASDQACDAGYNLALREAGTLADTAIVNVSTGAASIQVQGVKVVSTGSSGQSVIHTEPQLRIPYLPDVIARGAALSGVPGAGPDLQGGVVTETVSNTVVLKVPFSGNWPDTQAFRLRIAERPGTVPAAAGASPDAYDETFTDTGQPKWDPAARVLTVFLGKGQTARVRYSSYPDLTDVLVSQTPAAVPQLGYLHWWISIPGRQFTQQQVLALAQFAATGVNWQVSPFGELVLVHAVQQPLFGPSILFQPVQAKLHDTSVTLAFTALFNALSTGKMDLFAAWKEPVDDPNQDDPKQAEDEPKWISGHAHVGELRLEPPLTPTGGKANAKVFSQLHLFGDTKFRSIDYFLRATTAFREYFPPAITADPKNITRDGPKVTLTVPNRARPAAPKVLYAVPSFGWDPVRPRPPLVPGAKLSSRRLGGGLRVYLDRPWFSSGAGELLGVVLRPAGEPAVDDDPMKNVVTTWGRDVIFQTAGPPDSERIVQRFFPREQFVSRGPGPTVANFRGYEHAGTSLNLDEANVDVVGYKPVYDRQRKLWYADVQIDPGTSYFPFVRLALARYQPDSIAKAELSRVLLCDFAQLVPDRTVNVAASADGKVLQIDVTGFEPDESGVSVAVRNPSLPLFGRNHVDVAAEIRDPGNPDPDIGWQPATTARIAGGRPGAPPPQPPPRVTIAVRPVAATEAAAASPQPAAAHEPATAAALDLPPGGIPIHLPPGGFQGFSVEPTLWSGTITVPEPIGSGKYRIVVKEFESYYDDDSQPTDPTRGVATRLVYADTVDV
jgi:hypothetical protein